MDRRQFFAWGACAIAHSSTGYTSMALAKETQSSAIIPLGSIDCHVHVFEPDRFSYAKDRSYTPGTATVDELQRFHERIGIARTVLVQPSTYGVDNRCLLAAVDALGKQVARGVAVVDAATVTDAELEALKTAGVVGVRVNLSVKGEERVEAARRAVAGAIRRVADHDLVVQVYVDLPLVEALADIVAASPVPVVLDHFAGARIPGVDVGTGLDPLRQLLDTGKVWIKLSAPYRVTARPDFADIEPLLRTLIAANPDRLVWASDWPHTGGNAERHERKPTDIEPFRTIDDARARDLVVMASGSEETKRKIFVDNAERLFRF